MEFSVDQVTASFLATVVVFAIVTDFSYAISSGWFELLLLCYTAPLLLTLLICFDPIYILKIRTANCWLVWTSFEAPSHTLEIKLRFIKIVIA